MNRKTETETQLIDRHRQMPTDRCRIILSQALSCCGPPCFHHGYRIPSRISDGSSIGRLDCACCSHFTTRSSCSAFVHSGQVGRAPVGCLPGPV